MNARKREAPHRESQDIIRCFRQLTASAQWQLVETIPLNFPTHHPQGLVKIGDALYLSSVEILSSTERFPQPRDGYDRSPGAGIGHLFRVDSNGNLLQDRTVGEGSIYHPGGIDYDGESIWMPVAEYRPHSRSIIYRVAPETLEAAEIFRCSDHIGGLAYNRWDDSLHGISWGSRTFYEWRLPNDAVWDVGQAEPEHRVFVNGSHYIDYQDCQCLEPHFMLCSGLNSGVLPNIGYTALGGLELVDLTTHLAIHQIPVLLYSDTRRPMTQNPFWVECRHDHLRVYFIPDDDDSTLYIYDAVPGSGYINE